MKFSELTKTSTKDKPSELMSRYLLAEASDDFSMADFLHQFEFDCESDIYQAVKTIATRSTQDAYMTSRENQKDNKAVEIAYLKWRRYRITNGLDKYASNVAAECWARFYEPERRAAKIEAMFAADPDPLKFAAIAEKVKTVYCLTDRDILKLRFFAAQVKAGEAMPKSLRRLLFLWGATKKTGKTTTAEIIATILNGDTERGLLVTTSLSREMQMEPYAVPLITSLRCCVMDEAFFVNMRKTYNRFKSMMTTTDGTARLPYGQTFGWHGLPNYIATSNDDVRKFIEDYNDRRFLTVEFRQRPEQLTEAETINLWTTFLQHAAKPGDMTWEDWSSEIAEIADEVGARGVKVDDWRLFFDSAEWLERLAKFSFTSYGSNDNRLSAMKLRTEVSRILGDQQLTRTEADELELAFVDKYGPKTAGGRWWLISDLKAVDGQMQVTEKDPFND